MNNPKEKSDFACFIEDLIDVLLRTVTWILVISAIIICVYETPNISAWDDITDNYTCVLHNFYISEDSIVVDANTLNEFVETLPPVFINEFRSDWRVIIGDYVPPPIAGYTDWNSRIVFVKNQASITDTLDIFVHELGHCFDFEYGSVSYSDLFGDIYDLYKDDFNEQYTNSPDGYSTSSAVEFFAACFKEYMLYPEHLKTTAPKAYDFIDDFYKDIQNIKYVYIYDLGAVGNTVLRLGE